MEKKDTVFVTFLGICFLIWAVVLSGKEWEKRLELRAEKAEVMREIGLYLAEAECLKLPPIPTRFPVPELEPEEIILPEEAPEENLEIKEPRPFVTVEYEYFDDALLVGDSRMEGIKEYGNLEEATFFADAGMSVFSVEKKRLPTKDGGKATFEEVLNAKEYGKVYLMLGLNELGYQEAAIEEKYQEIVGKIREAQGDAIIFLCANLHVTDAQSKKDSVFNNAKVDRINDMIFDLADGENYIYIDINEVFDDENGGLGKEYSSDAFHVYAKHYREWVDWLCTKGIL